MANSGCICIQIFAPKAAVFQILQKIYTTLTGEFFAIWRGREKILFMTIVNVLGHPKGLVRFPISSVGAGMDFFWNDPIQIDRNTSN